MKKKQAEKLAELNARADEIIEKYLDGTGATFGYIGNVERWGDDRAWYIFLPHPGRIGTGDDCLGGGVQTNDRYKLIGLARALRAGFDLSRNYS